MREILRYASERGINNFIEGGLKDVYSTIHRIRLCVQIRLVCLAGVSPVRVKARSPVA